MIKSQLREKNSVYARMTRGQQRMFVLALLFASVVMMVLIFPSSSVFHEEPVVRVKWSEPADRDMGKAYVMNWIHDVRSVAPSSAVERGYIDDAYSLIAPKSAARQVVNNWFERNSPFDRGESVEVTQESAVRLNRSLYEVRWHESKKDRDGHPFAERAYKGVLSLSGDPQVTTAKNGELDRKGVYVTNVVWGDLEGNLQPVSERETEHGSR